MFPTSDKMLLQLEETQKTNHSYVSATQERYLFIVHLIFPNWSQSGNHPHCPKIASPASGSSLKNFYFTDWMLTLIITAANSSVPLLNLRKLKQYIPTQIASFSSMHACTHHFHEQSSAFQHYWNLRLPQCRPFVTLQRQLQICKIT